MNTPKTSIAQLRKVDWSKIKADVLLRFDILEAMARDLPEDAVTDKIANDLFLPAMTCIADFCARIEVEQDHPLPNAPQREVDGSTTARIDDLLKWPNFLTAETEMLLLLAREFAQGACLPSQAFMREMRRVVDERRELRSEGTAS